MRRTVLLALALALAACSAPQPVGVLPPAITPSPPAHVLHERTSASDFQAGVTLLLYGNDARYPTLSPILLDRLAHDGANSLGIVIPLYQSSRTSSDIGTDPVQTPSDAEISSIIIDARTRGFTVLLRPVLDEANAGPLPHWRGDLNPSDPALWFANYSKVILHYAALAASVHADGLGVGTELHSMESNTAAWSDLVANVQKVFPGWLTYSSNWSTPPSQAFLTQIVPSFAFVAVDAYYPLTTTPIPTQPQLQAAWTARALPDLAARAKAAGKPVVLTEIGVIPYDGVFNTPWDWSSTTAYDPAVQAAYYTSACSVLKPAVSGIYWWNVGLVLPQAPKGGFNPLVLPATEASLQECYT